MGCRVTVGFRNLTVTASGSAETLVSAYEPRSRGRPQWMPGLELTTQEQLLRDEKDGTYDALTIQHDATRQSSVKSKQALVAMGNSRGGLRLTFFEVAANAAACAQQTQA
uniref:Uncharacterized protein n=1 Tax=Peronospora matthiolae TaxID=2874970 RepID=A0AAV1TNC7_9STRA